MNAREEKELLIEKMELIWKKKPIAFFENLADFILEDRKRIVEPLVNSESDIALLIKTNSERRRYVQIFNKIRKKAIDQTLKNASTSIERLMEKDDHSRHTGN